MCLCAGGWVFVCVSKVCLVPAAEINCKLEALSLGDRFTHMAVAPASKQARGGGVRRYGLSCTGAVFLHGAGRLRHLPPVTPNVWVSHELSV